jgi:hypothetical protein
MVKMLSAVVVAGLAAATMALATPAEPARDAEVQAAIDARLHQLLVKLNDRHR